MMSKPALQQNNQLYDSAALDDDTGSGHRALEVDSGTGIIAQLSADWRRSVVRLELFVEMVSQADVKQSAFEAKL
jgi:hypothetical protein